MAIFQSYQADAGNLEDLIPIITMISPNDAPLTSSMQTKKATAMTHEWLTDALGTPALNAQVEGDEAGFGTLTPRLRKQNYVQNIRKTGQISDNQEAVLKAGIKSEYSYQLEKATKEIALDSERAFIQGTRSLGDATTAAQLGGLMYWLTSNRTDAVAAVNGTTTASGAATVTLTAGDAAATSVVVGSYIYITETVLGTGAAGIGQYRAVTGVAGELITVASAWDVAPAAGTLVSVFAVPTALTETILNDSFEACYNAGGSPDCVFTPTAQKRAISGFGTAVRRLTSSESSLSNSIDIYESDFGRHAVKTNRWMPAGSLAVVETGQFAAAYLRPVKAEELARTGSSRKFMIESAVTMEARAENSSGLVLGLA
jgi:hypothetical protein